MRSLRLLLLLVLTVSSSAAPKPAKVFILAVQSNMEGKAFASYEGQGTELAGFVWFQGWNDMIDTTATAECADNPAHFIRDVRRDLKAPGLPLVIGQRGVGGMKASGKIKKFKYAQPTPAELAEFKGNAALVKAGALWDEEVDAVFRKGWKEHLDEWNKARSGFPYHDLGSAKAHLRMGRAFAAAALELMKAR